MDYEKKYKETLEKARQLCAYPTSKPFISDLQDLFPELAESDDERIRKELLDFCKNKAENFPNDPKYKNISAWITWLEKQVPVDEDEIVKGIRRGVAISLMNHIDANSKGMCLSNMECEDIENAIVNEDWDKVYSYMKKKLEKQGEQKLIDKIQLGKKYKCIASPRYSTFIKGFIYIPQDKFLCSLMNFCSDCFELIEDGEQKPTDKTEPKFKVGQIITDGKETVIVSKLLDDGSIRVDTKPSGDCWFDIDVNEADKWRLVEDPAEWSEEDDAIRNDLINYFRGSALETSEKEVIDWLKSLKDRVQPQNKWKESLATADLENSLCDMQDGFSDTSYEYRILGEAIEFIRCTEPKPQWKPSEGQLECLGYAIEKAEINWSPLANNRIYLTLKALKEQLEKL